MALIVRDEEATIEGCLASFWAHVDVVAVLDTGSTDGTLEKVTAYAAEHPGTELRVGHHDWTDDFAAARSAADAMLDDVSWRCWIDADDRIEGAEHLRTLALRAGPDVAGFYADYAYAHDHHGNLVCTLPRERLVRAGHGRWEGRVHEAQTIDGLVVTVGPDVCRWVHAKPPAAADSNARNLRILTAWHHSEPHNPRVLMYLGTELAGAGHHEDAIGHYRAYLGLVTDWDQERAQVHRKLARSLMALGRHQDALETALAALAVIPDWPDSHLSLAEACHSLGAHDKAVTWAREVLRLGQPSGTVLILNPMDYVVGPRLVLAGSLGALGRVDEAAAVAREALELVPDHAQLRAATGRWEARAKCEHVANTWIGAARMLVSHDEQLKALDLLECTVPHFAVDHPAVVAERSRLRERLLWARDPDAYARHHTDGGAVAEEPIAGEDIDATVGVLPRARMVAAGLAEQDGQTRELEAA